VINSCVIGEICHQYDGMINNKTDSGMVATVKNWWDNTKEQRLHEMAIATCAFLPKLDSICIDTNLDSAEQALKQIVDISSCMEQCDATHNVSNQTTMQLIKRAIVKFQIFVGRCMNREHECASSHVSGS